MTVSAEHKNIDQTVTSVYIYITFFPATLALSVTLRKYTKKAPVSQPLNNYLQFIYKEVLSNYIVISTSDFSFNSGTKTC